MARIAGVDLPLNKRVEIGLTYIYGIGRSKAKFVLEKADVRPDTHVKDLSEDESSGSEGGHRRRQVEGDLRRDIPVDIKRVMDIGCYRGMRHAATCRCAGSARTRTRGPEGPRRMTNSRQERRQE